MELVWKDVLPLVLWRYYNIYLIFRYNFLFKCNIDLEEKKDSDATPYPKDFVLPCQSLGFQGYYEIILNTYQ